MPEWLHNTWPILAFLLTQTIGFAGWAVRITTSVKVIENNVVNLTKDVDNSYPQRDGAILEGRVQRLEDYILSGRAALHGEG